MLKPVVSILRFIDLDFIQQNSETNANNDNQHKNVNDVIPNNVDNIPNNPNILLNIIDDVAVIKTNQNQQSTI